MRRPPTAAANAMVRVRVCWCIVQSFRWSIVPFKSIRTWSPRNRNPSLREDRFRRAVELGEHLGKPFAAHRRNFHLVLGGFIEERRVLRGRLERRDQRGGTVGRDVGR